MRHPQLLVVIGLGLLACVNNSNRGSNTMTKEEFERTRPIDMIAVETSFQPTLDITDELRNTSLEDLIIQGKGDYSKRDQSLRALRRDQWIQQKMSMSRAIGKPLSRAEAERSVDFEEKHGIEPPPSQMEILMEITTETTFKFVPISSNLAKVYYLEDKGGFIRNNKRYYEDVQHRLSLKKEREAEAEAQKNWDKYLE